LQTIKAREPRSKDASVSEEQNSPVTTRLETPLSSAMALQSAMASVSVSKAYTVAPLIRIANPMA
jgi:hypothetical protein